MEPSIPVGEIPVLPPQFIAQMRRSNYERACDLAWSSMRADRVFEQHRGR
jgi:hypothetical protein